MAAVAMAAAARVAEARAVVMAAAAEAVAQLVDVLWFSMMKIGRQQRPGLEKMRSSLAAMSRTSETSAEISRLHAVVRAARADGRHEQLVHD